MTNTFHLVNAMFRMMQWFLSDPESTKLKARENCFRPDNVFHCVRLHGWINIRHIWQGFARIIQDFPTAFFDLSSRVIQEDECLLSGQNASRYFRLFHEWSRFWTFEWHSWYLVSFSHQADDFWKPYDRRLQTNAPLLKLNNSIFQKLACIRK